MKLSVIGFGNMASAIVKGALAKEFLVASDLTLCDLDVLKLNDFVQEFPVGVTKNVSIAVTDAQAVLLAVKPQHLPEVLAQVKESILPGTLVVSIAAGVQLSALAADLPAEQPIIRVMPNLNAQVGAGMAGLCANSHVDMEQKSWAEALFESVGKTTWIAESHFPIYTALAGCTPGWFFRMIDALASAGVLHGMPKAQATQIVAQAMAGSGQLMLDRLTDGVVPQQLVDAVCSPGGVTTAGLWAFEEQQGSLACKAAVDAAVYKDRELGK